MPTFDYRFEVDAPVAAVNAFHHRRDALPKLVPPLSVLRIHEWQPLAEGSRTRFTLWVGPLPVHWLAVHHQVSESGFTDRQASGPARRWEHTHRFTEQASGKTQVHEHIEFEHGTGFWGLVTRILFCRPSLFTMFAYRSWVTRREMRRLQQGGGSPNSV